MSTSPNPWELVFQQAVGFHSRGELAEAASLFAAIVEHNPSHLPSLHRLAAVRRYQGRLEESLELLQLAMDHNPTAADIHNSLGNTFHALGRQKEAVAAYRRAVELNAHFPEAYLNLGNSLKAMGRDQAAAEAYQSAIRLRSEYVEAHTNLGVVLERLNRPEEALASFSSVLSFDPTVRLGYSNLGRALSALNRHQEAIPFFEKARAAEPDALEPIFNRAIAWLAMGDYARGFRDYEVRLRLPDLQMTREYSQPVWDGEWDIPGKTILLHAEQGLGDTILFARYIPAVLEKGAQVVLEVQKPLLELMSAIPGVTQVLTAADAPPDFDMHVSFCSLPLVFRTTLETIPWRAGYLKVPGAPVEDGPSVGVCWAGNANYAADYKRSIPLPIFSRIFQAANVRFLSMQQNLRAGDEAILAGFQNIDLTSVAEWRNLADTADAISKLDLVITVDTAMAHLAGALGKPVWVLLPFSSYWVWGRKRTDSAWYASAELFRQHKAGDWTSVLERVCQRISLADSQGLFGSRR